MKTKAAVLVKQNHPLEILELEIPPLKRGQVLVKIAYSGICRSQLNEINGQKGPDPYLPHTLGHEGSGIVQDIGPGVTKVEVGDPVVLTWIKGEGLEGGSVQYQSVNSGPISAFMTYGVISENRLVPIPKTVPLRQAALFGCAIPTGAGIVYNELAITPDSTVAIFGLGGIGMSALLALKTKGIKQIIAIDVEDKKLILAKELGASETIKFNPEGLQEKIRAVNSGEDVDFSIEAAGKKEAMEMAFQVIKDRGKCVLAGNVPKGIRIACDPFDFIKGKQLVGTAGGSVNPDKEIPKLLTAFESRDIEKLISHEVTLEDVNQGLHLLETGQAARVLIKMGS